MSVEARESARAGARVVGVLLQCLAVVCLIGAFVIAYELAQAGQRDLGVPASNDPAPWITLGVGLIAALTFAGLGYSLAILCAIYDRQTSAPTAPEPLGSFGPPASTPAPRPSPAPLAIPPGPVASSVDPRARPDSTADESAVGSARSPSALWEALTKERHLRRRRG